MRFLPISIALNVYNYLVYIRRVVCMLRRRCLNYDNNSPLLFSPAASSASWKTAIISKELRHFCKISPGFPTEFGFRLYRQISIAITERHIRENSRYFNRHDETQIESKAGAALAWQSGHRPTQRYSMHGLDRAYPDQLQPALLQLYLNASEQWHAFLHLRVEECRDNIIANASSTALGQRHHSKDQSSGYGIIDNHTGQQSILSLSVQKRPFAQEAPPHSQPPLAKRHRSNKTLPLEANNNHSSRNNLRNNEISRRLEGKQWRVNWPR